MVKLLSITGKNSLIDTETIPKSTLQLLFLCSIVGSTVFARKDDKTNESKSYPSSPTYRFNDEIETGFENENHRNYKSNSDRSESNWNGMKGVYGYRNSDAFRMMDYIGRNYGFNGKALEPGVSPSNPTDVVIKGKDTDDGKEIKGQINSKIQIKNLIQNHRMDHEMLEQKPERLTQMNGDESVDETEEEEEETPTTETPATTTSSTTTTTTTPSPTTESTTKPPTTTTTTTTIPTTTNSPTPSTPVSLPVTTLPQQIINNNQREIEGRQSVSLSTSSFSSTVNPTSSSADSLSTESMKHRKSLHNKLSVHQLISESMPTLQMSVSPIYFYNKQTRSLVAIPYLIMKSTSKMPLLPGMMDSMSGSTSGGPGNLINYINSPFNQKLRSRSINHLSPLLEGFDSRSTIDDKLTDLSYSSHHHHEQETSPSSRWITVQGSSNGQQSNHELNW